ncbi:MAG TPA: nuclear transport factor 2 family protein [Micromonosporaceae bacterium]|jgi:ketosteroid isomerase-like protein|nr:nuclear transport factor 2 family protein [Micromonosporaceae bacterium]
MNAWPQAKLRSADRSFFQALLDRDVAALETLLSDQFLIVDVASGSVHRRVAFLLAIGAVIFQEIETFPEESVTRLTGTGTGIVIGRTAISYCGGAGSATELASRYTHVFQADGRNWRLLSAQWTPIGGTSAS